MDVSHLMDDLNDVQREAVGAPPGPLPVLAGAGSDCPLRPEEPRMGAFNGALD